MIGHDGVDRRSRLALRILTPMLQCRDLGHRQRKSMSASAEAETQGSFRQNFALARRLRPPRGFRFPTIWRLKAARS